MGYEQHAHGSQHHDGAEDEEGAGRHFAKDEGAGKAAYGTENEVHAGGEAGLLKGQAEPLHEYLGGGGVGAHVDAHMTHDAEEAEQDEGAAQQPQAAGYARSLVGGLLLNGGNGEHGNRQQAAGGVNQEQHSPAQPEGGEAGCGAPNGQDGSQERGDGFHKLAQGEGGGQVLAADEVAHEGVERGLHDGVAYAQQGEGQEHRDIAVVKQGKHQREGGDNEAHEHGLLAAYLVHQHARGHGEYQEPEEDERGEEVGFGVGQAEVFLHIVGGCAHQVNEAHGEEAEHDGYHLQDDALAAGMDGV